MDSGCLICWHGCQGGCRGGAGVAYTLGSGACSPLFLVSPFERERDGGYGLWTSEGFATDLCPSTVPLSSASWHVTRKQDAHGWLAGGTSCRFPIWHSCSAPTWHATYHDGSIPKTPACASGPAPDACPAPRVSLILIPCLSCLRW